MNSQNLKYAYEILDNIFEKNIAFSLGGYHSLVKQNILEEFRPINDIDVNIIIDKSATDIGLIQDRIVNYFHDFSIATRYGGDCFLKLDTEPERDYYKRKAKQDKERSEVESDVCFSISLSIEKIVKPIDARKFYESKITASNIFDRYWPSPAEPAFHPSREWGENPQPAIDSSDGIVTGVVGGIIGNAITYTTVASPSFYWSGTDVNVSPSGTYVDTMPKIKIKAQNKEEDPRIFVSQYAFNDFIKKQTFDKLVELILSSNNKLTIDFFIMEYDPKHNQIAVINEENYTAYYPILKAKHRYCTEKFTPEESFKKHIHDLTLSFNAKRIKGLNYPEDIELLIKNWEEIHEKDK